MAAGARISACPPAVRRENDRQRNKDQIKARIEAGPPPGLLAFEDETAIGWMQIGPRADVPEWNNQGRGSAPLEPHGCRRSGGLGDLLLLRATAKARGKGADPSAGRRRHRFRPRERRALARGLPDGPVEGFAFDRPVRRLDPRLRESRLRARRDAQAGPPADALRAVRRSGADVRAPPRSSSTASSQSSTATTPAGSGGSIARNSGCIIRWKRCASGTLVCTETRLCGMSSTKATGRGWSPRSCRIAGPFALSVVTSG